MEYFPIVMDHIVTLFSLRLKDYTQCSFLLYNIVKNCEICYFVFCGVLFLMSITAFYINLTNMLIMPFSHFIISMSICCVVT